MARASKFTDEQRLEIAFEMLSEKMSVAEVCRKWNIISTYAYKLKYRSIELLRNGIGRSVGRVSGEAEQLQKKVTGQRCCTVSGNPDVRAEGCELCEQPRNLFLLPQYNTSP